MATVDDHFQELMRRIGEGSEEAAWELVEQYGESIRRAVRRALHGRMRYLYDSLDFVQLVWSSFFRAQDGYERFSSPGELAAFLAVMARNKVGAENRRLFATDRNNMNKRCRFREWSLAIAKAARGPAGPVDAAIARERWNRLLSDQPAHYRRIIALRLQHHTYAEIAAEVGLAEGNVRRFLEKLSRRAV